VLAVVFTIGHNGLPPGDRARNLIQNIFAKQHFKCNSFFSTKQKTRMVPDGCYVYGWIIEFITSAKFHSISNLSPEK